MCEMVSWKVKAIQSYRVGLMVDLFPYSGLVAALSGYLSAPSMQCSRSTLLLARPINSLWREVDTFHKTPLMVESSPDWKWW